MITAFVFVHVATDQISRIAKQVAAIDGVSEVYSVTGGIDLIVIVRVREFELVAEVVTDAIRRFPEVTETNTHIAFRAHGRPEVEAAFSLGDG